MLPRRGREITDVAHWEAVRVAAEQAARELQVAAGTAPTQDAAGQARAAGDALAGLTFALESARLLQAAQPPPSADQLAEADRATEARQVDLDAALTHLDVLIGPPAAATPPPGASR
jgi:hypothetical protein